MNLNAVESQQSHQTGSIRPGLILVIAVVVLLGILLAFKSRRSRPLETAPETMTEQEVAPANIPSAPRPTIPATPVARSRTTSPSPVAPTPAAALPEAAVDNLPRTQETVQAAGAIARLTQLGSTNALTAEQAGEINAQLNQIANLGTPAVAAIRDFLQKDLDMPFGKQTTLTGGNTPEAPASLRMGLIDALGKIGGSEAMSVAADLLQKTLAPGEIGLLAKTLEQQAPGEYRDAAVAASREALAAAAKNPSSEQEVSSLFQILQTYGDSSVIPDLQNVSNQWRYYGLIAIAGLPEGQGVPALIEMATRPGAQASGYQQLALQMLAQLAPTNPDAQAALIAQAKAGQVSNWNEVAMALSGARLQYREDLFADEKNPSPGKVTQTHHVVFGNQNFRTVASEIPAGQIEQNRTLIDQLLGVTSESAARDALQRAKEALAQAPAN